jgi:hypothetical protein
MTLVDLFKKGGFNTYPTDKGTEHSYLKIYDQLFSPYQDKKINLFEVGYYKGGSCKLWEDYFPEAIIRVIDIDLSNNGTIKHSDRVQFEWKDIRELESKYFKKFPPDIAIDDGSHFLEDQIHFIDIVYPKLRDGGLLIIEDILDINNQIGKFQKLGIPFEVFDLRKKKKRLDDVLIVIRK